MKSVPSKNAGKPAFGYYVLASLEKPGSREPGFFIIYPGRDDA
jgi:hypothetical protein